jgi:hypothetical protein
VRQGPLAGSGALDGLARQRVQLAAHRRVVQPPAGRVDHLERARRADQRQPLLEHVEGLAQQVALAAQLVGQLLDVDGALANLALELGVVLPDLVGQRLDAQDRLDARDQLLVADRLDDEVVGADLQSLEPTFDLVVGGGQEQHRQPPGALVGAQPAADLEAVHAWHLHVQQDQVVVVAPHAFQRGRTTVDLLDRVIGQLAQRLDDGEAAVLIVID